MEKLAQELGVDITIFDYQAIEARILNDPDEYGITNLKEQCMVYNAIPDPNTTVCAPPDEYFYWDAGRPTRRVHQIIGEAMAEQLSK
jgi:phospholipase/lecithinase/hemolysin